MPGLVNVPDFWIAVGLPGMTANVSSSDWETALRTESHQADVVGISTPIYPGERGKRKRVRGQWTRTLRVYDGESGELQLHGEKGPKYWLE